MASSIQNVQVRPHNVYIGKSVYQVDTITCIPATLLSAKYFLFTTAAGIKHYAWFNTGASVDPAPAGGWVGHAVTVTVSDAASTVATALAAILNAVTGVTATASGSVVSLVQTTYGYAQPCYDAAGTSATNFAFKLVTLGQVEKFAGLLKGDIEIKGFAQKKLDITAHSTGSTILAERITGYDSLEVSFTFQESDKATLQDILVLYGMPVFTPVGLDKDALIGYGPANVGGQNPQVLLRMHPTSKDNSDKSEDFNIWFCELGLDSFKFSGENISEIPAKFKVFPDTSKPKGIQFLMIGDAAKAGY